ncbi:MAG: S8/S53 family peptidase [Clostridiaceae bacterium]|nr:S8/S53 family peptidase [Clostridiaceae bacterium]
MINTICRAQESQITTYRIKVYPEKFAFAKTDNKIVTSDLSINELLNSKVITDMHQSFPYSKKSELLNIYTIKCFVNDTPNVSSILRTSNSIKKFEIRKAPVAMYEPSDYHYTLGWQWSIPKVQANLAWDITKGGDPVTIAIVDTRFDRYHPDLENKYIVGYDPYSLVDHIWRETTNTWQDHGTIVASIAISETSGGGKNAAIGFNTKFYAYTWDEGVEKAHHASLALGVDVISISWFDNDSYDPDDALAIHEIIDNGTIIAAAAGNGPEHNDGLDCCPFCALNDPRVIVVTTTGYDDEHTLPGTQDSHYPNVDICAPGFDLMVAMPSKNNPWPYFGTATGTSGAAPQVAAVAALMRSVNNCITPEQVEDVIKSTADPVTDEYLYPGLVGSGRINAYNSVLGAIELGTTHVDNLNLYGTQTFSSGQYLSSSNTTVKNGANITYQAGRDITLAPGFGTEIGGTFQSGNIAISCP